MSTYDLAHKLAKQIKNSEEYQEYIEKREEVISDEKAKEMLLDYHSMEGKYKQKAAVVARWENVTIAPPPP